jgi:hypothetical protein
MKKILFALAGGLLIGVFGASYAKLPPPTSEERAAAAGKTEKDTAAKAKAAKELGQAQDKAVANYRKKKGSSFDGAMAPDRAPGADHARTTSPRHELTRKEAQTGMPTPGQANDHSTPARDPRNPAGR